MIKNPIFIFGGILEHVSLYSKFKFLISEMEKVRFILHKQIFLCKNLFQVKLRLNFGKFARAIFC